MKGIPPSTIRSILSGLSRVLKEAKVPFFILDKSDHRFRELLLTLDTVTSDLHREGIGVTKKSAQVISFEHEEVLWKRCSRLGYSQEATEGSFTQMASVFPYVVCKNTISNWTNCSDIPQIRWNIQEIRIMSTPSSFPRTSIALKIDINSVNKTVKVYAQPDSNQCIVHLLDHYISKLPEDTPGFTCAHWKECLMMIRSLGTVEA